MIYLSDVEAGGYTVFPQAGVSVKPELGSALYWFNYGAQNNYDSRTYHLGNNQTLVTWTVTQLTGKALDQVFPLQHELHLHN